MTDHAARYLGFAFASAELLFELDPQGQIVFALGATQKLVGMNQEDMIGQHWSVMFAPDGQAIVGAVLDGLEPTDRRGPVRAALKRREGRALDRYVSFSTCRLPQNAPNVSCTISLAMAGSQTIDAKGALGLHTQEDFVQASEGLLKSPPGVDLDVSFVEFQGLTAGVGALAPEQARERMAKVAAAVRAESFAGQTASQIGGDRFAMVRVKTETAEQLLNRLTRAVERAGVPVEATGSSLPFNDGASDQSMRALKFALDAFIKDGAHAAGAAFSSVLADTRAKAAAFTRMVAERSFRVVYQPIVDLKTAELHHFEVLSRLQDDDGSPASIIHMAEELEMIHELDMAVADQAIRKLGAAGNARLKLAVNLSARSLMRPGFIEALLAKAAAGGRLGDRLIFEVTESAELNDLQAADAHIQALRSRGYPVCLDDFGAGSASLSYLQALTVDTVKIDGQYVKDLAPGRPDAVVRHITELCARLKIATVAEMIETSAICDQLAAIGVDHGQGYYFGRPTAEPAYQKPVRAASARRAGAVESWS